jgi:hypothetical protein
MVFPLWSMSPWRGTGRPVQAVLVLGNIGFQAVLSNAAADGKRRRMAEGR